MIRTCSLQKRMEKTNMSSMTYEVIPNITCLLVQSPTRIHGLKNINHRWIQQSCVILTFSLCFPFKKASFSPADMFEITGEVAPMPGTLGWLGADACGGGPIILSRWAKLRCEDVTCDVLRLSCQAHGFQPQSIGRNHQWDFHKNKSSKV